jgi:transcription termination factor Rho
VEADRPNSRSGADTAASGAVAHPGSSSNSERRDWRKPARRRGSGRRGGRRRRRGGDGPEAGQDGAAAGAPAHAEHAAAAPQAPHRASHGERAPAAENASEGEGRGRSRRRRRQRREWREDGPANTAAAPTGDERAAGADDFDGPVYADGYDEDIEYRSTRHTGERGTGERGTGADADARVDGPARTDAGREHGPVAGREQGPDAGAFGDGPAGRGRRRRRRGQKGRGDDFHRDAAVAGEPPARAATAAQPAHAPEHQRSAAGARGGQQDAARGGIASGILITDKGGHGKLRSAERGWHGDRKGDVHVGPKWIQKHALREGMLIECRYGRGMGKHQWDITELLTIDGEPAAQARKVPDFRKLTSIDPDFHYEVGDLSKDTSLRVLDLICPIGRGQRGLIVAPPRSGKTVLMKKFAKAIEEHYPEVHLMVLLVDERPEEATDWQRSTKGQVFVSTNDEMPKTHVEVAEVVWKRAMRLVELGHDVIVLLDSITRLARAYNHVAGNSGKTMSGGLDTRAMERPKQFFGSARNTETAGSLTIVGTCLVETGSKMDQVIFEEFKGTGNMELVLSRKLADRRIFPAIDVERSGTRKEEKLLSAQRLRRVHTLRRVLTRMHFAEAMELLITRLDDVERNDDFLKRFDIDPEA